VCAVSFQDLLQQLKSGLYTHTVLVVVIGPYTFKIQKVAVELSNIIEGLAGVQLCTLFSTSNFSKRWYSEYNLS